jgi:peptidoglycan/LPS O-acetylase OafA/YrhL
MTTAEETLSPSRPRAREARAAAYAVASPTPPRSVISRSRGLPGKRPTLGTAYDPRANNFDFIRFALASLVIWSHSFPLSGREMDPIYAGSRQIDAGSLAVDGFFIVSGFLIMQSWMSRPRLAAFLAKRALRILPALSVAIVFGAFLVAPWSSATPLASYVRSAGPWKHFAGVALHRYLFIPGTFPDNPIPALVNSPLWSLRYEVLCYALVGALGMWSAPRLLVPVVAAIFVAAWSYAAALGVDGTILVTCARLMACFFAGALLFLLRDHVPFRGIVDAAAALLLAVTFVAGGFRSAFPIAGGYLLLALAAMRSPLRRFGRFGDFSYGLYVFAYPIQQSLVHFFGPNVSPATLLVSSFVPTLLVAALSWHFVEAPALALKRRVPASAA